MSNKLSRRSVVARMSLAIGLLGVGFLKIVLPAKSNAASFGSGAGAAWQTWIAWGEVGLALLLFSKYFRLGAQLTVVAAVAAIAFSNYLLLSGRSLLECGCFGQLKLPAYTHFALLFGCLLLAWAVLQVHEAGLVENPSTK